MTPLAVLSMNGLDARRCAVESESTGSRRKLQELD